MAVTFDRIIGFIEESQLQTMTEFYCKDNPLCCVGFLFASVGAVNGLQLPPAPQKKNYS